MLEEIVISDIASYQGNKKTISPLSKINFFYGANGSGKPLFHGLSARTPQLLLAILDGKVKEN